MNSTIIIKMLPTPSFWSFLFPSLALHGFLGLILLQAAFSPKPPFIERVITIQIVEAPAIREEKRVPSSVPIMMKKISSPSPSLPPMEKDLAPQTVTPPKEEWSAVPSETLNSPKQDLLEQLPRQEGERKSAEIAERPTESTTAGHEIKGFSLTLEEKPGGAGGLPTRKENRGSVAVVDFGLGGSIDKSPEKKQTEESGSGQGQKTGSLGSLQGEGKGRGDLSTYLSVVRWRIDGVKKYPREAIRKNWEGIVVISFQIDRQGEVNGIKLIQSSGHLVLDEEGKATLKRASPLPLPPLWEKENLELQIPILFSIDRKK